MCAKWIGNEQQSEDFVQSLLEPVKWQFVPDGKGGVAGMSISLYDNYSSAIDSYIELNREIPDAEKSRLIGSAIWKAAAKKLTAKSLLEHVVAEESDYLSKPKEDYEFVGSLSVRFFEGLNRSWLNPTVRFSPKLSSKYDSKELLLKNSYLKIVPVPLTYTFFRIPVRTRNYIEAYRAGIDAIDLLRGIWNWYFKPQEFIFNSDQSQKPLNSIRLGPFQTILEPTGKLSENFWTESDFRDEAFDIGEEWIRLSAFEKRFRTKLKNHPFRVVLEDALCRMAQALDYSDKHIAFLKLWQVIEKLTATQKADYETLIKRVAFLYEDHKLNKAVLNHLKLYRNSSVHDGIENERIEKYLFQLLGYVRQLLNFHVGLETHEREKGSIGFLPSYYVR